VGCAAITLFGGESFPTRIASSDATSRACSAFSSKTRPEGASPRKREVQQVRMAVEERHSPARHARFLINRRTL